MALEKITKVAGRAVHVPGADIDTDRIIPARFMKCVTFDGLGEFAFHDARFHPGTGEKSGHALNDPRFHGASILLAGVNFGCGSSREHAPQALRKFGFRAVVAESFAGIFFGNSTTIGFPCVTLKPGEIAALRDAVEADPATEITIDLVDGNVRDSAGHEFVFQMPASARDALTSGRWDPIQELIDNEPRIRAVAETLPCI